MRKPVLYLVTSVSIASMLLVACARPAPVPIPTPTGTATPKASPTPKLSPTPTGPAAETPRYGGVLKTAEINPPRSLIPETNTIKNWFMKAAYDTLLRLDENDELQPFLATDWKLSPDKKSLTLGLRKGVKFHDGSDFNAAAVKFNIEIRKAARVGDYQSVTTIDIIDDYTLRLNLDQFQNTFFTALWFIGGMINSPTTYQKLGRDAAQWQPVGTGPFKFVNYVQSNIIKYERFDGYWQKGKPYLDGFEQSIISDATTRTLAFKKGETHHGAGVNAKETDDMMKEWPYIMGTIELFSDFVPDSANADSPFANKKVREAVEYAVDRVAYTKSQGPRSQPLNQMTPSGTYAYIPDLKGREYNLAKAKQLLAEAGYPNGFKTKLITRDQIAEALVAAQTYLKEAGIDAPIDLADAARYISYQQQGWKNALMYGAPRIVPDWLAGINTNFPSAVNNWKSLLRPPGFDDMVAQAMLAPDLATKKAASQAIVRKMHDEAMVIPLWGTTPVTLHHPYVRNLGYHVIWGPNKLWSPADVWLSK